jgi:hypothetical protein
MPSWWEQKEIIRNHDFQDFQVQIPPSNFRASEILNLILISHITDALQVMTDTDGQVFNTLALFPFSKVLRHGITSMLLQSLS